MPYKQVPCDTHIPDNLDQNGDWAKKSSLPCLSKPSSKLYCDCEPCTKDSDEWRALNPTAPASSAKCFQHASEACAFKIAMDTKLDKQPGVTSLKHAAQIIRKLHYKDLDSNSFGKGSKYNRPWDGKRDKDIHIELRNKQKALGLFPKPDA